MGDKGKKDKHKVQKQKKTKHDQEVKRKLEKQPNHQEKLKELGAVDSWKRSEFIEKGGWDKMPGQKKAGSEVAQACAQGLEILLNK